jgi:recombination protein RecA
MAKQGASEEKEKKHPEAEPKVEPKAELVIEKELTDAERKKIVSEKMKALNTVLADVEKKYGEGTVMKLGDRPLVRTEVIPTGALCLDLAIGIGGLPKGRIVEIYGPESGGKTTLALTISRECQKRGGIVAYIDVENALDPVYASQIGVEVDDLIFSQPNSAEDALNLVRDLTQSGGVSLIVVDSVTALVPEKEQEGEIGDSSMGLQARLMSQSLRMLIGELNKSQTTVIFINQIREKIGVTWGPTETTTGGRALKFYSSVRLDIRRTESIKVGEGVTGNRTKVKIVKNKVAPPFKVAEFDIIFGKGIDRCSATLDVAEVMKVVDKSGAWYYYNGTKIGQGKNQVIKYLEDNHAILKEIEAKTRQAYYEKPENLQLDSKATTETASE